MNLYNFHRRQTWNVGDVNCGPAQYFRHLGTARDLDEDVPEDSAVILGGGGLLHEIFNPVVEKLQKVKKLIVWGVGTNTHGSTEASYPDWFLRCQLVGVRDYGTPHRWVPCVSAMHHGFQYLRQPSYRVVQYLHFGMNGSMPLVMPTLTNAAATMEVALSFLASGEFVVTNTYHGAYWATLLGRRVIMYPFSSRHFHMKHPPVMARPEDKLPELMERARSYPEALAECRDANTRFEVDVRRALAG